MLVGVGVVYIQVILDMVDKVVVAMVQDIQERVLLELQIQVAVVVVAVHMALAVVLAAQEL